MRLYPAVMFQSRMSPVASLLDQRTNEKPSLREQLEVRMLFVPFFWKKGAKALRKHMDIPSKTPVFPSTGAR